MVRFPILAIIFGRADRHTLLPEAALAFIRHAVGKYYRDATRIAADHARIHWKKTLRDAMLSFRDAVLRYGHAIRHGSPVRTS